jgi:hypothetical protein
MPRAQALGSPNQVRRALKERDKKGKGRGYWLECPSFEQRFETV